MTALLYAVGVLVFAVGVAASIALHECGHMVPAKRFGVKVTQFFVGFGRTVWSTRRGETEYGLKAIPLGGYVKLVGMLPPAKGDDRPRQGNTGLFAQLVSDARTAEYEHVGPGDQDRLFYRLAWWKKVVVMAGGPTVNLGIAFVLFAGIFGLYGTLEPTTTVQTVSRCVVPVQEEGRACTQADPPSPAYEAGLRPGDRIVSFNGTAVRDWQDLVVLIRGNADGAAVIGYERDGELLSASTSTTVRSVRSLDADGAAAEGFEEAGFLGVESTVARERHGLLFTVEQMGSMTWETVKALGALPVKVYGVAKAVVGLEERALDSPVSVVGAGRVAGEVTSDQTSPVVDRVVFLASLLAGLNLFVGMFNFIPLLPLDGGHIAGALYEAVRRGVARVLRRPDPGHVDVAKLLPVAYVMASALLVMGLVLIVGDIVAPVRFG
ncbi:MAG: Membrane-associated zinc metalloprotease [uncultured Nocardioidaceae bacterium]|uniref:Membrane-associated zinc metalloprotease n=1 Tax=uncultured Nocardioidaceae bacterium TaxID=253824 RepID=A0A6J4M573_9ACTN|nr:MAG: Membrane-associated zinc metalloprotease [uncultured Nocardioidaceae bacterium]